jgi:4-hydroxybenzoate polyprenyltransferase
VSGKAAESLSVTPQDARRSDRPVPDAVARHWVDRAAPKALRPYLRLARIERPIGWWLLLLPCWWSSALAAIAAREPYPNPAHLVLFLVGAIAMRGAGATYNDIVDRDLDRRVERTRLRPLPSGQVSVAAALAFLVAQALVGLAVLVQFNRFAVAVGLASLGVVALYPFMKRVVWLPQIVLGLAFAWGGLMGWAAAFGSLGAPAVLIYLAAVAWTVGYDTIYALQDIEDDEVAGIRSSARFFGANVRPAVAACFVLAAALALGALVLVGAGVLAYLGLAAFAAHLAWQVAKLSRGDEALALKLFRSNRDAGLILFVGLALDALLRFPIS